ERRAVPGAYRRADSLAQAAQDPALRTVGGGHVEVAGARAISHRRPVRAAIAAGRHQDRLVVDHAEDAFGDPGCERLRALRHHGVAARDRLRRRGGDTGVDLDRLLVDAGQRLPGGAVEDVDRAGLAGLGDALARLAIDHLIEQDDRRRTVEIP